MPFSCLGTLKNTAYSHFFSVSNEKISRAFKKEGKTLDYAIRPLFSPTLLSCSTAFCVLYNTTEHSRGFCICEIMMSELFCLDCVVSGQQESCK